MTTFASVGFVRLVRETCTVTRLQLRAGRLSLTTHCT